MQILLSCAKTMGHTPAAVPEVTVPHFQTDAEQTARQLLQLTAADLREALHVNTPIATENARRYAEFFAHTTPEVPALLAYTGIVFKHLRPEHLTITDMAYAQQHLFITSYLYGLLRPLDAIRPYRLEGNVRLPADDDRSRFEHWKPLLTDYLIRAVKADDGVLVNLASAEMKRLFDWRRIAGELNVITPEFKTIKEGRERSIVIYTKMSRGQMARFILKNRLVHPSELAAFEPAIAEAPVVMYLH